MLANIATIIGRISALLGQSKVEQTISPKQIIDYLTKCGLRMERMNAISSYKPKKFNIESVNTV